MLPMPYPETCAGDDDNTVNSVSHGTVASCASGRTDGGCDGTATWSSSTPKNWFSTHCCATCGMRTDEEDVREGPEPETFPSYLIAIICIGNVSVLLIAGHCWKKHHRPNTVVEPVVGVARAIPVTIPGVVRGKVVG
jgi:hypothetical protein